MKNVFPGFYNPTDKELENIWKSKDTLFVFDTNTLLNLYGYASQTREDFFTILNAISDRIWLPYHVGLEYQRRRIDIIRDEKAIFNNIEKSLVKIDDIFNKDLKGLGLNRRFPKLQKNTDSLHMEIGKLIDNYRKSLSYWDKQQPSVNGHDVIREKLDLYFKDKIGDIPESQDILNKIYEDGKTRYENKIPPGYKDNAKARENNDMFYFAGLKYDRQYGDLIIWKQIMDKAREDNIQSLIFVTDDAKEDWWYLIESRGKKNIGPRAELREELYRESGVTLFTMYKTSDFLESGKRLLNLDVKINSIKDADNAFSDTIEDKYLNMYKNMSLSTRTEQLAKDLQSASKIFMNDNTLAQLREIEKIYRSEGFKQSLGEYDKLKPYLSHEIPNAEEIFFRQMKEKFNNTLSNNSDGEESKSK